jgi:hypothetical protein
MTCTPDNQTKFETEQVNTKKCEACGLFVKIFKYRSCEERFKWNENQGVDVLKPIREAERAAAFQTGKVNTANLVGPDSKDTKSPKKPTRRGR